LSNVFECFKDKLVDDNGRAGLVLGLGYFGLLLVRQRVKILLIGLEYFLVVGVLQFGLIVICLYLMQLKDWRRTYLKHILFLL
jgi:hypothetical protein